MPLCGGTSPGHLPRDCHDKRRSRRTSKRKYSFSNTSLNNDARDNTQWDDEIYGDGES
uniref:Uncharacterized protein n=1 Tax=Moniliophthora roreri TaxID=221103 RepID=A0A0W0G271_MONRR